jgi:IclR family pca regulon transcriptional regulator
MSLPLQNRDIAATFAKGMAVLAAFDGHQPSLTLADLARITGQDRAAVRRAALTLVQLGYLRQQDRQFALTPKILSLTNGFLQANQFGRLVQPVLNHQAAQLGAEIKLAMRDGADVLLLAQSTVGRGQVSFGFMPGNRMPLLHTSLGRMLLACEPADVAEDLVHAAPLPRHTEQSMDDPVTILAAIARTRRDGFNVTDGEFEAGIIGFSVPVSRPGAPPIVVGSNAPGGRAGTADQDHFLRNLQSCAAELRQNGGLDML